MESFRIVHLSDNYMLLLTEKLAKSLLSTIRKLEEDIKIEDYAFNESANFIIAVSTV